MLLSDTEVETRISSPLNLLNRLRRIDKNTSLPIIDIGNGRSPVIPPTVDQIIEDAEDKIKTHSVSKTAVSILGDSLSLLKDRLEEIEKPERLAKIASDMSKIYHDLKPDISKGDDNRVQVVIYAPQVLNESEFESIHVED